MASWTAADIPSQEGRTFLVTGGSSGLGVVTVRELAKAGANVVVAVRNVAKGEAAVGGFPGSVEVRHLDLADLAGVRSFAAAWDGPLDVLVNNAGIMATPEAKTADGFESQLGTNHLGHFALTGLLLGRVTDRVVTLSSLMHRSGRIRFEDLQSEQGYKRWRAYGQAKLANLMFAFELQRRLTLADSPLLSVAAHPGYAATGLQGKSGHFLEDKVMAVGNLLLAQSADKGALPTLYAATVREIPPGAFVGPDGRGESRGFPHLVGSSDRAQDEQVAARLWTESEALTGVRYDFGALAASPA